MLGGIVKLALVVNKFPSLSETFIHTKAVELRRAGIDVTVIAATPAIDRPELFTGTRPAFEGDVRYMIASRDMVRSAKLMARRLVGMRAAEVALWRDAVKRYGMTKRALRAWLIAVPLSGFDVVHLEYSGLAVAYLDALVMLRPTKLVVSCRGTAERMTPRAEPDRVEQLRAMFDVVDRVHCVSRDLQRICESYGLLAEKAFVNEPAIDLEAFTRQAPYRPRQQGPYELLSTGRLHWAKGLEYALLAVRELVDAGHSVHYRIIGGGPEEGRLRFAIHDLGLGDHVTLAGRQSADAVRRALEQADVYVLPSISEGISNAALEAMAMQLPVVTTDVGGMTEAIEHGREGLVVPSRAPAALARAIASLLGDPALRSRLGSAGRQRIERQFTIGRQISVFMREYGELQRSVG